MNAAFSIFRKMDEIFSTYLPQSQLMRLRRGELTLDQCSPRIREALEIAERAERLTGGSFTTLLPTSDGDLSFDPTGLVKGWTVDLASQHGGTPV